jgi:hypothetical protein
MPVGVGADSASERGVLEGRVVGNRADAWAIGGTDVGDSHRDWVWH